MRGSSITHVTGGDNPHFVEPIVCKHSGGPKRNAAAIEWPEPTPESDAFWRDAHARVALEGDTGRPRQFDHDEAMRRYAAGETVALIAADLGCTPAAIYALASRRGVRRELPEGAKQGTASQARSSAASPVRSGPVNGSHRVPPTTEEGSPARQREMRPDGAGDHPLGKIARNSSGNGSGPKLAPHAAEVVRRYEAGESSSRIAADYGVAAGAVTNLLHARGVPVRDRRQAQRAHYGLSDAPPTRPGEKVCNQCGKSKPPTEFPPHKSTSDGRAGTCRDCTNCRPPSEARAIRNRARNRAYAELVTRHKPEFEQLLEAKTVEVTAEFDRIRAAAGADEPVPRLKPGPKRRDQTDVVERLDVARCRTCHTHHDAQHVCPSCGDDTPENQPLVLPYVMRAWAHAQGMAPVPPTGPVPERIVNAYLDAHDGQVDAS